MKRRINMNHTGIAMTALFLALCIYSCTPRNETMMSYDPYETEELAVLMTGSFSSAAQAGADTNYYNISLHMYPIWPNEEADYLYVEQAVATMLNKPYRQRVYKLERLSDGGYLSSVYELANDSLFIGMWKKPTYFDKYSPDDLIKREGCGVYLFANGDGTYTGSTKGQSCESTISGAKYATSIVDIQPEQISSWDQGFDTEGKQVWGAENGPYVFKRKPRRQNGARQLQKVAK